MDHNTGMPQREQTTGLDLLSWVASAAIDEFSSHDQNEENNKDECIGCGKRVTGESAAFQKSGVKFCSETCFRNVRRADYEHGKTCDWCKNKRVTVPFQDGVSKYLFCSEDCMIRYRMFIFYKETKTNLNQNSDSPKFTENIIRPELWLKNLTNRSVSHGSETSALPVQETVIIDSKENKVEKLLPKPPIIDAHDSKTTALTALQTVINTKKIKEKNVAKMSPKPLTRIAPRPELKKPIKKENKLTNTTNMITVGKRLLSATTAQGLSMYSHPITAISTSSTLHALLNTMPTPKNNNPPKKIIQAQTKNLYTNSNLGKRPTPTCISTVTTTRIWNPLTHSSIASTSNTHHSPSNTMPTPKINNPPKNNIQEQTRNFGTNGNLRKRPMSASTSTVTTTGIWNPLTQSLMASTSNTLHPSSNTMTSPKRTYPPKNNILAQSRNLTTNGNLEKRPLPTSTSTVTTTSILNPLASSTYAIRNTLHSPSNTIPHLPLRSIRLPNNNIQTQRLRVTPTFPPLAMPQLQSTERHQVFPSPYRYPHSLPITINSTHYYDLNEGPINLTNNRNRVDENTSRYSEEFRLHVKSNNSWPILNFVVTRVVNKIVKFEHRRNVN